LGLGALLALVPLTQPAMAADDGPAADDQDGGAVAVVTTGCPQTLQSLIDAAAPGGVVSVPPCIYRETARIEKPLTLAGQPGAEIRGSDIWSSWARTGPSWTSLQTVPPLQHSDNTDQKCAEPTLRCLIPEQVFIDGQALYPVGTGPQPAPGQFALDPDRHVILADDPAGHLVEVTTRPRWINTRADNVTIQGLTMRHAGNDAQTGAISNDGHSNWTLQDNVLSDAHGGNVSIRDGLNINLLRNDISRGGNLGVSGYQFSQSLVQGNHLHDNGIDQFNRNWSTGGLKVTHVSDLTFDQNETDHNGAGMWCDEDCHNVTFSANRVHDNWIGGLLFEISEGGVFHDNLIWNNGWGPVGWVWGAGIIIASSANTEVFDNTLAWNGAGISVVDQTRPKPFAPFGHYVHDNTIIRTQQKGADFWANTLLAWTSDNGTGPGTLFDPKSNNRGAHNLYWDDQPEDIVNIARFAWYEGIGSLSKFDQTPGDGGGRYLTNAEKNQVLQALDMPLSPPPTRVTGPTTVESVPQ
jgi:hypothetical protein